MLLKLAILLRIRLTHDSFLLKKALKDHRLWRETFGKQGKCANLSGANLRNADLRRTDLAGANLSKANLFGASLRNTDLYGANLRGADLSWANLEWSCLVKADLTGASLFETDLFGASLVGAKLPEFQLPQNVELIVWKKIEKDTLVKLRIPAEAKRTAVLTSNKCRAEYAEVLEIIGEGRCSRFDSEFVYEVGKTVRPGDDFNDSVASPCQPGIHFFMTRKEAEKY